MPDGNRAQFAVSEAGEVIESEPRRKFLARLFWGAMGIVSAAIAAPVISYLIIPLLRPGESNDWVKMGNIADLPLNVPQRLEVGRRVVEGWETDDSQVTAWVVRTAGQNLRFRSALHALGMRLPMGRAGKAVLLSMPCRRIQPNRAGGQRPSPTSAGRLRARGPRGRPLCGPDSN